LSKLKNTPGSHAKEDLPSKKRPGSPVLLCLESESKPCKPNSPGKHLPQKPTQTTRILFYNIGGWPIDRTARASLRSSDDGGRGICSPQKPGTQGENGDDPTSEFVCECVCGDVGKYAFISQLHNSLDHVQISMRLNLELYDFFFFLWRIFEKRFCTRTNIFLML
jgi:hypothetical protein